MTRNQPYRARESPHLRHARVAFKWVLPRGPD